MLPKPRSWMAFTLGATLMLSVRPGVARGAGTAEPVEEPGKRILFVLERPDDAFMDRIMAEVASLGLTAIALKTWRTHETLGPLEDLARSQRAVAAIRMVATRKGVEVWMADETSGRPLLRQLVVDESPRGPDEGLVAMQTAELLRTSLLSPPPQNPRPIGSEGPSSSGTPAVDSGPEAGLQTTTAPATHTFGLQPGFGALFSPGGSKTALQAWLSLYMFRNARLGLALDLSAPVGRTKTPLSGPEGTAHLDAAQLAGLALLYRFTHPSSIWDYTGGFGLGAVRVSATGETSVNPFSTQTSSALTAIGYLRADVGLEVVSWLRLGVRAVGGTAAEPVDVRFAGNSAAKWGRFFAAGLAFADLRLH